MMFHLGGGGAFQKRSDKDTIRNNNNIENVHFCFFLFIQKLLTQALGDVGSHLVWHGFDSVKFVYWQNHVGQNDSGQRVHP